MKFGRHREERAVGAVRRRSPDLLRQAVRVGAKAILAYERELDLIVPRTCGFVRFAVEDEG